MKGIRFHFIFFQIFVGIGITFLYLSASCKVSISSKFSKIPDYILTFTSNGEGIDYINKKIIDEFLLNTKKKFKGIEVEKKNWGKEGEMDYCFFLTNISKENKSAIIKDIKKIIKNSELIQFSSEQKCRD